jgi:hypothetical protein
MTEILKTLAEQNGTFVPGKPGQYLALQIARRLSDESALRHYLVLFEHHPEDLMLQVFRRCSAEEKLTGADFMRTFREITLEDS